MFKYNKNKSYDRAPNTRTKTWGSVKYKPQPYRSKQSDFTPPDPQATAKPWEHVKNDIIDDSEEMSHASRVNVDSEHARRFMQQREQNHRRNIIETNRLEATKWETFDDEQQQPSTSAKGNKKQEKPKEKSRFWQCDKSKGELPTDVKNFSAQERNYYRRKITMGLTMGGVDLEGAINDLKRNKSQLQSVGNGPKRTNKPARKGKGNPFLAKMKAKEVRKKRKAKKSWEE